MAKTTTTFDRKPYAGLDDLELASRLRKLRQREQDVRGRRRLSREEALRRLGRARDAAHLELARKLDEAQYQMLSLHDPRVPRELVAAWACAHLDEPWNLLREAVMAQPITPDRADWTNDRGQSVPALTHESDEAARAELGEVRAELAALEVEQGLREAERATRAADAKRQALLGRVGGAS